MKNKQTIQIIFFGLLLLLSLSLTGVAQTQLLKRTTYKNDNLEFGAGGTVSVTGAPEGSIEIEGWSKNEVEISAEIEIQAENEADLARLATVNSFVMDESFGHLRIISVGTHDKDYMKKTAKKFPKNLLGMPFRINYKIKLPRYCDLNIDGGNGDFSVSGVDGEIRVKYLNSNAKLSLVGGSITATFGNGSVDVSIPTRGWRGRYADIQLATGTMNVELPLSFNAEISATVLRTGQVENTFTELKPRPRTEFTDKSVNGKTGTGGVSLNFTVGDGTLKIGELKKTE